MNPSKPVIVHVIDSLARGGAETTLVNLLDELNRRYRIILVTLTPENDFREDQVICEQYYCLQFSGIKSLPRCISKLRGIIKKHRPHLVRSQLYMSSVIARVATPKQIPFVFSIHNTMSLDSYQKNRLALPLEKVTYRKHHHIMAVSQVALDDFQKHVGIKGGSNVLYNFVNPVYFEKTIKDYNPHYRPLRMVAVGNLREQKNYFFILHAFKGLKNLDITLDIFGEGPLREELQKVIDYNNLKVTLRGKAKDIYNYLPDYDVFVMSSFYEGFGIAIAEAMAVGLPLILTDLPVLREVARENALFFAPDNLPAFVNLMSDVYHRKYDLKELSAKGIRIARENYQKEQYLQKLDTIYNKLMLPNREQ
jgi:glycosyltransferase involved in cell wall biosynthesis